MDTQLSFFDTNADYLESPVNEVLNGHASFRVHASLIYKLGESLIADEVTALSELIKNSYDADATFCTITINTQYEENTDDKESRGIIEISDNGSGMDLVTIVNGWLTISNSPKKKMKKEKKTTPKYHRYPLGDKGLGRLSVQKLGRYMQLITKKESSMVEYTVTIPWGAFLSNTTIDQIPVKIDEKTVENALSYTKIVIKDLIDCDLWAKEDHINAISNSISKIVSPFRSKENNFKVLAKINNQEIAGIESVFQEVLNAARAKYVFKYSDGKTVIESYYKKDFFYDRKTFEKVMSGIFSLNSPTINDFYKSYGSSLQELSVTNNDGYIFSGKDEYVFEEISTLLKSDDVNIRNSVKDPGNFECEIYEYAFDERYLNYLYEQLDYESFVNKDEFKDFIDRYHGIKVVRDGFVIRGFGDGDEGDWLGLSSSSKTTGSFFDLRNDSVIGCVYLKGAINASLKETTNREGFVEDDYFRNFKAVLKGSIKKLNRSRKRLNDAMHKYVSELLSETKIEDVNTLNYSSTLEKIQKTLVSNNQLPQEMKNYESLAERSYQNVKNIVVADDPQSKQAIESIEELYSNLRKISASVNELFSERNSLEKQIEAVKFEFDKINERIQDLFELAGLGISVELFAHEFDSSIRNIRTKNQQVLKSTLAVNDLIKHISYIDYSLDVLRKQMSYFNPGLKFVRAEKQTFRISEFLQVHKDFYSERCEKKNINFLLDVSEDFTVKINRGMLSQVFDNLFSNSEYWLVFSRDNGLISECEYNIKIYREGTIIVWDNGIGISHDIEKHLFEPFESKRPGGRGLGLYIAASNLRYNSSKIRLLLEKNKQGNLYKFEIDLSQLVF